MQSIPDIRNSRTREPHVCFDLEIDFGETSRHVEKEKRQASPTFERYPLKELLVSSFNIRSKPHIPSIFFAGDMD